MKMKRSQKLGYRLSRILIIFLCAIFLLNVVWPDKQNSDQENRSLQTFPSFNRMDLQCGVYTKNIENWFSDQFVGRQTFIHGKYWAEKLSGNKKIDNVFLGKGTLIEDVNKPNAKHMKRNLQAISNFYNSREIPTTFLLAPTAASILSDKLPRGAQTLDQNEQIDSIFNSLPSGINKVDIRANLEQHKDQYLYYRTDHHWTTLGAYYGFEGLNALMGYGNIELDDYSVYPVSTNFTGTLSKATGSTNLKDQVDIYVDKNKVDYMVTDQSTGKKSRSVYQSDALNTSDPYTVFLGGNHALVNIETTSKNGKHLLLIKDSYANALIPFLIPYYRTITVVDPRYYFDDIQARIDMDMIDEILYVYNSNTFVVDTSLADMLESASKPMTFE